MPALQDLGSPVIIWTDGVSEPTFGVDVLYELSYSAWVP